MTTIECRWFTRDEIAWLAADVEPILGRRSVRSLCDRGACGAYGVDLLRKLAPRGGRLADTIRERMLAATDED